MALVRQEIWGLIEYDPRLDEFVGHISDDLFEAVVDRPLSAGCLVTGRCNLHCAFCYGNDESLPTVELSAAQWGRIFCHLASWGLMRVDLSGGEPTIRRDIASVASAAIDAGLNVVLSTNGLVLHSRGPDRIPKDVRIHVSVDSGFPDVHEQSRALRSLTPSDGSFEKVGQFIRACIDQDYRVRVLTCVGKHNQDCLFQLGEYLAGLGVTEWNVSRVLRAGRAQADYQSLWLADDERVLEQVRDMRSAFPWIRVRYSNRTSEDGYFLLVLPDGTLATQYTDGRDKVLLGNTMAMSLQELQKHPHFDLKKHCEKWLAGNLQDLRVMKATLATPAASAAG